MKNILLIFISFFIISCSSQNSNYKKITDTQNGLTINASYIQWNDEYAVTAKHNKYPEKPDYISLNYDLVFFKNKAPSNFNENIILRNPYIEEEVIHTGSSQKKITLSREGFFINQTVLYAENIYSITSATVFKGMSGGPVYSKDKRAILGMTVAKTSNVTINGIFYQHIALFIQTETIENEWKKFQELNLNK